MNLCMLKPLTFCLIFLTTTFAYSQMFAQSGWTRNKGGGYLKTGFFAVGGNNYYDTEGVLNTQVNRFSQRALTFYGEYGINKNITAILNYPYFKFQNYDNYEVVKGIGDPQIEVKFSVLRKIPVVSLAFGVELPLAKSTNLSYANTENAFGVRDVVNLPTGDGDFNGWSTLAISSGFWEGLGWVSMWGRYDVRTEGYANQARLGIELGYKWTTKLWTNARLVGLYQMAEKSNASTASFINGQNTQWTTLNVGAAYELIKGWSVTFDWQTYNDFLVKRKNVYAVPLYQLGVSYEFK
jgi:hypothetical protein